MPIFAFPLLVVLLFLFSMQASASMIKPAFYYGSLPFPQELRVFNTWIVDPDKISDPEFVNLHQEKLFAYVSLGEVSADRPYHSKIPEAWLRGTNKAWQSQLIDQTAEGWSLFFLEQVIAPLHHRGYRHFFLDTLDSYHLIANTAEARQKQEQAMIRTIRLLKARFPDARLIFNRGFEILPQLNDLVHAVAAESLFQSWNNEEGRYLEVSEADRNWLRSQLKRVNDEYHLPAIVIDYLPPARRSEASEVATKIGQLGFIPWVGNSDLTAVGVGVIEPQPRRILMLHDDEDSVDALMYSDIHRFVAMPINHLGYVPEYLNINEQNLPDYPLAGRYAGIVSWFHSETVRNRPEIEAWLARQIEDGVPVAILGYFGFDLTGKAGQKMGLEATQDTARGSVRIISAKPEAAFEIEPLPLPDVYFPLQTDKQADVWLRIGDDVSHQDAVAITSWGGFALTPFVTTTLPESEFSRWGIDPMAFFSQALKLPRLPVPDVTTENGRRLLVTHIDGDGFASKAEFPGAPWAAEVLYREILKRYAIPTTVSVIEGETSKRGAYPQFSRQQEAIARKIFKLPHVEAASHSYSHPFNWQALAKGRVEENYNLPIPNYTFDEIREIDGSVRYVEALLPAGKRCRVFLWTGDCNPGLGALKRTYQANLLNMNGGETLISRTNPTLTSVAPLGISRDGYFQVYAPNQNENRYTNLWTGPYYGYERVIETFELTETPVRLKPINIYYHTYSASKPASLKALKRVYDWSLKQQVLPIHASTYIRKVHDFNGLALAREGNGWRIEGASELRTLRLTQDLGYPDLSLSQGVLGWKDVGKSRYVHLDDSTTHYLVLSDKPARRPYLIQTNARITNTRKGWKLEGSQPLEIQFGQAAGCRYHVNGKLVSSRPDARGTLTIRHPSRSATLEVRCAQ